MAIGDGAAASADGSVAIGQGSGDNGRGVENYIGKYSNASNTSSGTVSVGNTATGETRTVSNVADGLQATDAVNLRQLDGIAASIVVVENNVSGLQNGTDGMFQVNNSSVLPSHPQPVLIQQLVVPVLWLPAITVPRLAQVLKQQRQTVQPWGLTQ